MQCILFPSILSQSLQKRLIQEYFRSGLNFNALGNYEIQILLLGTAKTKIGQT
jgi:hypothetical protein